MGLNPRGYALGAGSDVDTETEGMVSPEHAVRLWGGRGSKSGRSSCLSSRANSNLTLTDTEHENTENGRQCLTLADPRFTPSVLCSCCLVRVRVSRVSGGSFPFGFHGIGPRTAPPAKPSPLMCVCRGGAFGHVRDSGPLSVQIPERLSLTQTAEGQDPMASSTNSPPPSQYVFLYSAFHKSVRCSIAASFVEDGA